MLVLSRLREERESVVAALKKRNSRFEAIVDQTIALDEKRRKLQAQLDSSLSESNKISKKVGELFKQGQKEEAERYRENSIKLKDESKVLQEQLQNTILDLNELLYQLPNTPHNSVPEGVSAEDNVQVFLHGEFPDLDSEALPHWELAKKYDLIDFELGAKITGAGFPVYKGKGARLQRALISFFLDYNTNAGYTEFLPPFLVNESSGYGTGQLPDKEGQMYHVGMDDLYLIPTAEVPITNLFRDELLEESDLPIACTAYTPCFRREAGSYGAHVRGLNRLHQFDKVEIVRIEKPEKSYSALDLMVDHVKELLNSLKLPYRILKLCAGDMGFTSALTYDFEVYSAAQNKWLEVSSVSNFEEYQANRLKLRFRDKLGEKRLVHTLNGSSLALPRIVACLLENNQTSDKIVIPEVLHPYTGFTYID